MGAGGKGSSGNMAEQAAAGSQLGAAAPGASTAQQLRAAASALPQYPEPHDLLALPQYQPFQAPDFNAAEFTSRVLAGSRTTAHAQAEELRHGVRQLDAALSAAVVSRHGELLNHTRRILDAEAGAQEVALAVGSLAAAVRRVRAEVEGPYVVVALKTRQLRALHATIDLLRALQQRLKLTAKLRQQLAVPPEQLDAAKAAKLLADAVAAGAGGQLAGIEVAAGDTVFLEEARNGLRDQAQVTLAEGMEAMSQAKVGAALQVFFNMGELGMAVDALIGRHVHDLERAARAALDSRHLSLSLGATARGGGPGGARGVSLPQPGAAGSWQEKLWQGLRGMCDTLVAGGVAVWHLQRVAAKKRDPLTHVLFLDDVCGPGAEGGGGQLLTDKYWLEALRVLGEAFGTASKPSKGGFVREALSGGYPKVVAALEAAFARLQQDTRVRGVPPSVAPDQLAALLAVAAPFRDAYLAAVLGRLQDVVGMAYPVGGRVLPPPAEVQKCIAVMHEELRGAAGSPQLAGQVAGVVGKALQLLAQRAEVMAATGPDLRAVALGPGAGGANPAQQRNIAVASQLQEVHRSLTALLPRLPPPVAAALEVPLASVEGTALDSLSPIFRALLDAMEAKIAGMHAQHAAHWGRGQQHAEGPGAMMDTSAHVADIAACLASFRSEYLARFSPPPMPSMPSAVARLCERSAGRLLSYFVRHAALLRPLPPPAKLQLAKDLAELQASVGSSLWPLEALGPVVQCLRGFRALLFVDDAALDAGAPPLRDLPPSLTLHHLFSRLPASIQAPHDRSSLTPVQYSRWLDQHSAADVVRGVAGALDAAQAAVAAVEDPGQRAVLNAMAQLCSGMAAASDGS